MRLNHRQIAAVSLLLALAAAAPVAVEGQTRALRIATYNIEDDINGAVSPLPGLIAPTTNVAAVQLGGVLEGIGEEIVGNDPAQPVDIIALEETTSSNLTIAPILNGLTTFYGAPGMYATSPYQATESGGDVADGNGPNAIVYNTYTVQLIASAPVDPSGGTSQLGSSSGEYREVMRYEFAPAGNTPAPSNEFYIYVSHYKSGTSSTDAKDRQEEAQIIRNDEANNLPASARVIYVGDYNVDTSGEAGYQTILAAAAPNGIVQGQGIDPLNIAGSTTINWESTTTSKSILLMLSESATDLRYRDDLEIVTSNVFYAAPGGLCLVTNTYHTFGNNGSLAYGSSVAAQGNTALTNLARNAPISASTLFTDLTSASDHLPVVADYTVPVSVPGLGLGGGTYLAPGYFQFTVTNADGSAISPGEASRIRFLSTTNLSIPLANWTLLPNSAFLSNGVLIVTDTNASSAADTFYRANQKP